MAMNEDLEDALEAADILLRAEFGEFKDDNGEYRVAISNYGDGWTYEELELERIAKEKGTTVADLFYMPDGSPNWVIDYSGFEIFDFALIIERKDSDDSNEVPEEIQEKAAEIIKPLGLFMLSTDGVEYAFGRYAPWYSAKSLTEKGWKYEYGIKDMQPEHPYWPDDLDQADSLHDCFDNAKVEIMETDMIILECEVCKKTAEFDRSTDFNRR